MAKLLPDGSGDSSVFDPLVGQTCNGSWLGYGSTLFLQFGALIPNVDNLNHPPREWTASDHGAVWRIERGDDIIAGTEDPQDVAEERVRALDGLQFLCGSYVPGTRDAVLTFSESVTIRSFQIDLEDDGGCWDVYDR